jgi:hypothetical protein
LCTEDLRHLYISCTYRGLVSYKWLCEIIIFILLCLLERLSLVPPNPKNALSCLQRICTVRYLFYVCEASISFNI